MSLRRPDLKVIHLPSSKYSVVFHFDSKPKENHRQESNYPKTALCTNAEKTRDTNGPSTFTQPIGSCPLQAIPPSVLYVMSFQKLPSQSPIWVKTPSMLSSTSKYERLIRATSSQKKLPKQPFLMISISTRKSIAVTGYSASNLA